MSNWYINHNPRGDYATFGTTKRFCGVRTYNNVGVKTGDRHADVVGAAMKHIMAEEDHHFGEIKIVLLRE